MSSSPAFVWRQSQILYKNPGPVQLVSWSEVQAPLSGHEGYVPYLVAIVRLADGSKRTAQLVDCMAAELAPDMKLMPVFRRIYESGPATPIVYGYKFTPRN